MRGEERVRKGKGEVKVKGVIRGRRGEGEEGGGGGPAEGSNVGYHYRGSHYQEPSRHPGNNSWELPRDKNT